MVLRYYIPLARTAIGLRVKDGVVLAVEKLVHSKLLVPAANRRIQTIDRHIGLVRSFYIPLRPSLTTTQASSGLLADGRHLSNRARDEAANYRDNYREPAPLKVCCTLVANSCSRLTA
jgi:20S proteasome subunit alpha 7